MYMLLLKKRAFLIVLLFLKHICVIFLDRDICGMIVSLGNNVDGSVFIRGLVFVLKCDMAFTFYLRIVSIESERLVPCNRLVLSQASFSKYSAAMGP